MKIGEMQIITDIEAANGVLHVIDDVQLPPAAWQATSFHSLAAGMQAARTMVRAAWH